MLYYIVLHYIVVHVFPFCTVGTANPSICPLSCLSICIMTNQKKPSLPLFQFLFHRKILIFQVVMILPLVIFHIPRLRALRYTWDTVIHFLVPLCGVRTRKFSWSQPPLLPFSFLCFFQDVFLMIRHKKTTIFMDAKESTTVSELKRMVQGITKRLPEDMKLFKDDQVSEGFSSKSVL